jgi:hypothetical protein
MIPSLFRGQGFLALVRFGSYPTTHPSPVSKVDQRHTERLRKIDNLQTGDGGGVGEEPDHPTARKIGPLYCKSLNTLWSRSSLLTESRCFLSNILKSVFLTTCWLSLSVKNN